MAPKDLLARLRGTDDGERKCKVCSLASGKLPGEALRSEYYKRVIERYAEVISFGEEKSIPELKRLVAPGECVRRKAAEFKGYRDALSFVQKLPLLHSQLSVPFWLSPAETLELGAGDAIDKAVLLCSLLIATGAKARVRVLELAEGYKHAVVVLERDAGVFELLDACEGQPLEGGSPDDALQRYAFQGKQYARSLYEFDAEGYDSFQ